MKKMFVFAMIVIGTQLGVQAQEKRDTIRSHHKSAERMKMKEELGLNADQAEKMKAINEDSKAKLKALRDDKNLAENDRKEKVMSIMKERKEKVDAILTPDQRVKMKEWEAKRKDHMKEGRKKHWKGKEGKEGRTKKLTETPKTAQ